MIRINQKMTAAILAMGLAMGWVSQASGALQPETARIPYYTTRSNSTTGKANYIAKAAPDPAQPPGQLYNLRTDPGEFINLYNGYPEIVDSMERELESIRNAP